jgi:hypothetical protein
MVRSRPMKVRFRAKYQYKTEAYRGSPAEHGDDCDGPDCGTFHRTVRRGRGRVRFWRPSRRRHPISACRPRCGVHAVERNGSSGPQTGRGAKTCLSGRWNGAADHARRAGAAGYQGCSPISSGHRRPCRMLWRRRTGGGTISANPSGACAPRRKTAPARQPEEKWHRVGWASGGGEHR